MCSQSERDRTQVESLGVSLIQQYQPVVIASVTTNKVLGEVALAVAVVEGDQDGPERGGAFSMGAEGRGVAVAHAENTSAPSIAACRASAMPLCSVRPLGALAGSACRSRSRGAHAIVRRTDAKESANCRGGRASLS